MCKDKKSLRCKLYDIIQTITVFQFSTLNRLNCIKFNIIVDIDVNIIVDKGTLFKSLYILFIQHQH